MRTWSLTIKINEGRFHRKMSHSDRNFGPKKEIIKKKKRKARGWHSRGCPCRICSWNRASTVTEKLWAKLQWMEKRTERAAASAHPFTPRPPPAARPFCLFGLGGWLKTLQNKQPSGYVSYTAFGAEAGGSRPVLTFTMRFLRAVALACFLAPA